MCLHTLALVKFESLAEAKAQQDAEAAQASSICNMERRAAHKGTWL